MIVHFVSQFKQETKKIFVAWMQELLTRIKE